MIWENRPVSFNDDSSPHTATTGGLRVSIDAQVIPGKAIDWYYDILSWFPNLPDELKSPSVIERFNILPTEKQREIWRKGLSEVRVHIVDPRPYRESFDDMLRTAWKRDDAPEHLNHAIREGFVGAREFADTLQEQMANLILFDSTAGRLHSLMQMHKWDSMVLMGEPPRERHLPISVSDFNCTSKSVVRKTTEWAAKSAAAFQDGVDALMDFSEEDVGTDRYLPMIMRRKLLPVLSERHVFDKGDERQLNVLEDCRRKLVVEILSDGGAYLSGVLRGKAFEHQESHKSPYVQAADFAAGIASHFYSWSTGPVEVVSRFEYVTYNGGRISMCDAEEIVSTKNVKGIRW